MEGWQQFLIAALLILVGLVLLPYAGFIGGSVLIVLLIALAGVMVYKMIKGGLGL